jgi:hypothetical protein
VLHHVVAVAKAAPGLALLDPASKAAMDLGGEILRNRAFMVPLRLEADVKLADLAFAQRDDLHPGEAEMLARRRIAASALACVA